MRRLPLFPLPVVLLPGAMMPLHVFEPRYRQMVAHCVEADDRFGLVYHDPERAGPFRADGQIGCVAEILRFQPLPDGRSLLLVRGERRFRIEDGIESEALYHEALVEEVDDADEDAALVQRRAAHTVELFRQVLQRLGQAGGVLGPLEPAQPVSFQLAQRIRIDAAWEQALLERHGESARLEQLDELLRAILEEPGGAELL